MVISMCGMLGTGSPTWWMVTPALNRAALISRPEMNWLDFDASTNTSPPRDLAGRLDHERQAPRAAVVDRDAEVLEGLDDGRHGTSPGVRVAVEGDLAVGEAGRRGKEAHDGAGESDVDGSRGRA